MKTWLNEGTRPPAGAPESWQPRPSETTSATPRAAIVRCLDADDMTGLGTFCQHTRADSQRSMVSIIRIILEPGSSPAARCSRVAPETRATDACAPGLRSEE